MHHPHPHTSHSIMKKILIIMTSSIMIAAFQVDTNYYNRHYGRRLVTYEESPGLYRRTPGTGFPLYEAQLAQHNRDAQIHHEARTEQVHQYKEYHGRLSEAGNEAVNSVTANTNTVPAKSKTGFQPKSEYLSDPQVEEEIIGPLVARSSINPEKGNDCDDFIENSSDKEVESLHAKHAGKRIHARQKRQIFEHYDLSQKGYSGLPRIKERQLMNNYMEKLFQDYRRITPPKDSSLSGFRNGEQRATMNVYSANDVQNGIINKRTDFMMQRKNVKHASKKMGAPHKREIAEHYDLWQKGYSGLPKLKERQIMNTYMDKLFQDYQGKTAPKDSSPSGQSSQWSQFQSSNGGQRADYQGKTAPKGSSPCGLWSQCSQSQWSQSQSPNAEQWTDYQAKTAPKDSSLGFVPNGEQRTMMNDYSSKEFQNDINNKTTDFMMETKNVRGPSVGNALCVKEKQLVLKENPNLN